MCGFVAIIAGTDRKASLSEVEAATAQLAHRGPDDSAYFSDNRAAFGFRRLSIFDLSPLARQPMSSPDGRHVIIFNGAIYNWLELRRELKSLGHSFTTHGDTEVLLCAWRQWGTACLHRLNGMFAFLVWDRSEQSLFGARDRFGVKPMYWAQSGDAVMFASEIKALRALAGHNIGAAVNWDTVADFLENGRLDAREETFFEGVRRVPAGACFTVESGGRIRWMNWWSLESAVSAEPVPTDPAAQFAATFEDAVRLRMRGDVPVGVLLSGGLDSTSIVCAMARGMFPGTAPRAFGFVSPDAEHDESAALDATIAQTGAMFEAIVPAPDDLLRCLDRHLWYQDEPVYSFSSLVAEHLVGASRRAGVKILLNGQGADEVLAGYPTYFATYWSQLLRQGRLAPAVASMWAVAKTQPRQMARRYMRQAIRDAVLRTARSVPLVAQLLTRRSMPAASNDWLAQELQIRAIQFRSSGSATLASALRSSVEQSNLPIFLRQEDRNAMAHGVEARLPFLDHRLVTLAFALGDDWKISGGCGKRLLRESMRGRVPEVVRAEPRKLGFPTPLDAWFRGPLREPMGDLLNSRDFREAGIWQTARVQSAFSLHQSGQASCGTQLFDVAQTTAWLRNLQPRIA
jgi:asparagine synthase (glutamine-hydrolysing)